MHLKIHSVHDNWQMFLKRTNARLDTEWCADLSCNYISTSDTVATQTAATVQTAGDFINENLIAVPKMPETGTQQQSRGWGSQTLGCAPDAPSRRISICTMIHPPAVMKPFAPARSKWFFKLSNRSCSESISTSLLPSVRLLSPLQNNRL